MRSQTAFARSGRRDRRLGLFPFLAGAAAAICLVSGLYVLWVHANGDQPHPFSAPTGVLLIALCGVQGWLMHAWWSGRSTQQLDLHGRMAFWLWLFSGVTICYLVGMLLGPTPGIGFAVTAAVSCWYTALVWLLVRRTELFTARSTSKTRPILGWIVPAMLTSVLLVASTEVGLRLYSLAAGDYGAESYLARTHALRPGQQFRGRRVNALGYWGDEFKLQRRPGVFRIAVLGDGMALSGTATTNCLARIENALPGVEIYNFGILGAGPREYAAQLAHEVARFEPDLVLTFFSVGDDVTHELPMPGPFEWQSLRLYQLGSGSSPGRNFVERSSENPPSHEAYVRAAIGRLAVCRTPIDDYMSRRWEQAMGHLDEAVSFCRDRNLPTALVLVPGEFQVNTQLCAMLCRQAGVPQENVDLDLPQRRLLVFAKEREIPVLDLLPPLRASQTLAYVRNDRQLNDHGHQIAADVLGRWIAGRYGPQLASRPRDSLAVTAR